MRFEAYASSSAGNLYTVDHDGEYILIEAGVTINRMRRMPGFPPLRMVEAALISHHHGDHSRAISDVMRAGVDVYASNDTWRALGRGHGHHRMMYAKPLVPFELGWTRGWRVLPFDVRHDAEGALGYLVEDSSGDRLMFACDTAFVPYRFLGLTHVAIECNYSRATLRLGGAEPERVARVLRYHMSLERVVRMLLANDLSKVREIWLLHLSDQHGDEDGFRSTVARATGKPVHVAPKFRDQPAPGGDRL